MKTNKRSQTTTTKLAADSPIDNTPTPEEVAERAFQNFEQEGSLHGSDLEHWLAAESSLLAERSVQ